MLSSILEQFTNAWNEFKKLYNETSEKYGHHGYDKNKKSSDPGPHFWSEQDIVLHLSFLLQKEFGRYWVHNELSLANHTFRDFDSKTKEYVDIVISDPDRYADNWRKTHDAFVEVKWITRGKIYNDYRRWRQNSEKDCAKLKTQLSKNRCKNAYLCIVDDAPSESGITKELGETWEIKYSPVKVFLLQMSQQS
jgi:hypothetical protein